VLLQVQIFVISICFFSFLMQLKLRYTSSINNPPVDSYQRLIYLLNLAQLESKIDMLRCIIYVRASNARPSLTTVQCSAVASLNLLGAKIQFFKEVVKLSPTIVGRRRKFAI